MKARLVRSIAIGASVAFLIQVLATIFPRSQWQYLGIPAYIAMISIWGPHGPIEIPGALLEIFLLLINTIVYGLIVFGILTWLGKSRQ